MVVIPAVSDQVNVLDVPGGDVVGQEVRPLCPGQVEEVEGGESGETFLFSEFLNICRSGTM